MSNFHETAEKPARKRRTRRSKRKKTGAAAAPQNADHQSSETVAHEVSPIFQGFSQYKEQDFAEEIAIFVANSQEALVARNTARKPTVFSAKRYKKHTPKLVEQHDLLFYLAKLIVEEFATSQFLGRLYFEHKDEFMENRKKRRKKRTNQDPRFTLSVSHQLFPAYLFNGDVIRENVEQVTYSGSLESENYDFDEYELAQALQDEDDDEDEETFEIRETIEKQPAIQTLPVPFVGIDNVHAFASNPQDCYIFFSSNSTGCCFFPSNRSKTSKTHLIFAKTDDENDWTRYSCLPCLDKIAHFASIPLVFHRKDTNRVYLFVETSKKQSARFMKTFMYELDLDRIDRFESEHPQEIMDATDAFSLQLKLPTKFISDDMIWAYHDFSNTIFVLGGDTIYRIYLGGTPEEVLATKNKLESDLSSWSATITSVEAMYEKLSYIRQPDEILSVQVGCAVTLKDMSRKIVAVVIDGDNFLRIKCYDLKTLIWEPEFNVIVDRYDSRITWIQQWTWRYCLMIQRCAEGRFTLLLDLETRVVSRLGILNRSFDMYNLNSHAFVV